MLDREVVRQNLLTILQEDTAVEVSDLADATNIKTDLNLDSVDFVGIIMRIEGDHRIRLSHEELEKITTVGDLLTMIQNKATAAAA